MAHRDFAGRSGSKNNKKKAKKSFNRNTLIVLALVAVLGFGLGLYFLKSKTPAPVVTTNVQPEKPQPKSVLPNRPEEVWHYIKEMCIRDRSKALLLMNEKSVVHRLKHTFGRTCIRPCQIVFQENRHRLLR